MQSRTALGLIVVVFGLAACAGSPAPRPGEAPTPRTAAPSDPDQAALEALRTWAGGNASEAARLAARATKREPRRPDLAWLHLRVCMEAPRCDAASAANALKQVAPENGASWLVALQRAQRDRDARTEEQVLVALSAAPHVNVYWTTLLSRLSVAARASAPGGAATPTPLTATLNEVTLWLSRLTLPAFAPLNQACEVNRLRDPMRRATCERLAQALQASDSYAAEGLGLGIAQRLAAPGSREAAQLEDRIDVLAYQNRAAGEVMTAQVEREKFAAELLKLMQKLPREQDVSRAVLRWAGQPVEP